jgi:hypothetical protein
VLAVEHLCLIHIHPGWAVVFGHRTSPSCQEGEFPFLMPEEGPLSVLVSTRISPRLACLASVIWSSEELGTGAAAHFRQ